MNYGKWREKCLNIHSRKISRRSVNPRLQSAHCVLLRTAMSSRDLISHLLRKGETSKITEQTDFSSNVVTGHQQISTGSVINYIIHKNFNN